MRLFRPRAAFVALALLFTSCGSELRFYPVRGSVFVNGKPAEGVLVIFHPDGETLPPGLLPSARVEADGSFSLKSYVVQERAVKDGAPAGRYRVTCVWYPPDLEKYLGNARLPDRLNGKYATPASTSLTAEVLEKATELSPFQLESK